MSSSPASGFSSAQRAAATGRVNAERLPLSTDDPAAALPSFNGAVQQHCALIISVGTSMAPALDAAAAANLHQRFVIVGGTSSLGNVTEIPASAADAVADSVYSTVMNSAGR